LCETGSSVAVEAGWRGEPGRARLYGIAIATTGDAALLLDGTQLADPAVRDALCRLTAEVSVHAHRAKELMRGLAGDGVDVTSLGLDTAVAAYLVDPAESQYLLEDLCLRYAGLDVRRPDAPPSGQLDLEGTAADPAEE